MTTTATPDTLETIELPPSYTLPIGIILLSLPLLAVNLAVGVIFCLFGIFLVVQTATIRLKFTPEVLEVYRNQSLIRSFPYTDWQTWYIFWPYLPVLFFFREVKSIHFLPMLFDPKQLRICLEQRCTGPITSL